DGAGVSLRAGGADRALRPFRSGRALVAGEGEQGNWRGRDTLARRQRNERAAGLGDIDLQPAGLSAEGAGAEVEFNREAAAVKLGAEQLQFGADGIAGRGVGVQAEAEVHRPRRGSAASAQLALISDGLVDGAGGSVEGEGAGRQEAEHVPQS